MPACSQPDDPCSQAEQRGGVTHSRETYAVQSAWTQHLRMDAATLASLLSSVTYATTNDPVVLPVISAVCLEVQDDVVVAQAFGGFRAAYHCSRIAGGGTWQHDALLRSAPLELAAGILAGCGQVTLEVNQGVHQRTGIQEQPVDEAPRLTTERVAFTAGDTTVEIAPLDGRFPPFRQQLLAGYEREIQTRALVSAHALQEALEDLLPSLRRTLFVRLHIERAYLRVEVPARHGQEARERRVDLLGNVDVPAVADFHCGHLLETLRAMEDAGEVWIELPGGSHRSIGFFRTRTGESTHVILKFDRKRGWG